MSRKRYVLSMDAYGIKYVDDINYRRNNYIEIERKRQDNRRQRSCLLGL